MPDAIDQITTSTLAEQIKRLADAIGSQQAEGLDPKAAAAFCGISISKLHQLNAAGQIPAPSEIGDGRLPRWSKTVLRAWLIAGSPSRLTWRAMEAAAIRKIA